MLLQHHNSALIFFLQVLQHHIFSFFFPMFCYVCCFLVMNIPVCILPFLYTIFLQLNISNVKVIMAYIDYLSFICHTIQQHVSTTNNMSNSKYVCLSYAITTTIKMLILTITSYTFVLQHVLFQSKYISTSSPIRTYFVIVTHLYNKMLKIFCIKMENSAFSINFFIVLNNLIWLMFLRTAVYYDIFVSRLMCYAPRVFIFFLCYIGAISLFILSLTWCNNKLICVWFFCSTIVWCLSLSFPQWINIK